MQPKTWKDYQKESKQKDENNHRNFMAGLALMIVFLTAVCA